MFKFFLIYKTVRLRYFHEIKQRYYKNRYTASCEQTLHGQLQTNDGDHAQVFCMSGYTVAGLIPG